jgi:hypothetical protein
MYESNFLSEMIGNYYDCIVNIIYKLQRYTDALLKNNTNTEDISNPTFTFLIYESENIVKNNLYISSLKLIDLYEDKYKNLIDQISKSENRKYYTSHSVSVYFQEKIKHIDWDLVHYQSYNRPIDDNRFEVFNFQKIFEEYLTKYSSEIKEDVSVEVSKTDLLKNLNECYTIFSKSMADLSSIMKNTLTAYNSAVVMNDLIRFMIVTYICVSKIHII